MKPDDNNYVLKNFFHLEKKNNKKTYRVERAVECQCI